MYSDDSDYDYDVDESSMKKRTHLTIVDAQIAVNQQQIVATEDDRVSYFAHPALGSRRMKGGFSVVKNSGQIILDDMVEQLLDINGQTVNGRRRVVKFVFNNNAIWSDFLNQLRGTSYSCV